MKNSLTVRVARKAAEAVDICAFELVDVAGGPLPGFSAGSHVDVQVGDGLTRQYSLCNDPSETHRYLIGVLRDPASRGGSAAMHDRVQEGDQLQISTPKNHFALAEQARHSVLLAGGIGVTPILCMAERLSSSGASFETFQRDDGLRTKGLWSIAMISARRWSRLAPTLEVCAPPSNYALGKPDGGRELLVGHHSVDRRTAKPRDAHDDFDAQ